MKRKFVSACMAIICVLSCAHISVPAMNAGDKIMVIEDFEGYTSTSNMIAKAFQAGTITAQNDTVAECILSDSEAYSGSKSFGAGGTYTPIQGEYIGGMISPYLLVPEGKRDWTNASYLQFWVKNPVNRRLGIKLQLGDGQTFHTLPASNVNVYLENRPGEGVYNLVSQIEGTYRIWIPSGFEGMVRVPLSLFSTITDFSNIMKIYLGMNVNHGSTASGVKYFYYDYFHVVTSDWQTPVTKQYTPELIDIVVRIDEKNHQLKVSGTINPSPVRKTFCLMWLMSII